MGMTPPLPEGVYKTLKWIALVVLPGAGALYYSLGELWGWPYVAQTVGTIVSIDTFLGVLLGLSTANYNKSDAKYDGAMVVGEPVDSENPSMFSLELDQHPLDLLGQKELKLKVVNELEP